MTLYRYNLRLSQEMYAIISCFEVSLRNKINNEMRAHHGNDWLRDFVMPGGRFDADPRVPVLLCQDNAVVSMDGY